MRLRVLQCPRCGKPLPRRALLVRLKCEYCRSDVTVDRWGVKAADYRGSLESHQATSVLAAVEGSSERGAEHFSTLLPQRVAFDRA